MRYNIIKLYTEKLNIGAFYKFIDQDSLNLSVTFNNSLLNTDNENVKSLKMEYSIDVLNAPISLNWIAVGVLEFEDVPPEDLNVDDILTDDIIKKFIESSTEHISFLVGGELPSIYELKQDKNHD